MVSCVACTESSLTFPDLTSPAPPTPLLPHPQSADISNPTRNIEVYRKWIEGVMMEFFVQVRGTAMLRMSNSSCLGV